MQNRWLTVKVHKPLCDFLQSPHPIKKLIELPRGFLKTTIASEYFPIWLAINNPAIRVLIVQNTFDNAAKRVHEIRSIFESKRLFRALYPEIIPNFNSKSMRWSDECAEVNRPETFPEGTFEAAGIQTKIVARHYDVIIEDDLVTADVSDLSEEEIAPNMEDVAKAIGWHRMATNLSINYKTFMRIQIGTRWFTEDMINYVKTQEPGYAHYFMTVVDDNGDPIYPERFDEEVLAGKKIDMGTYMYATQMMLDPLPLSKMIFKPFWNRYYDTPPETNNILAIDPAIGETKQHCDTAFIVAGGANNGLIYIKEAMAGQYTLDKQIKIAFALIRKYNVRKLIVETIAYQEALAQAIELERDKVDGEGVKINEDVHFTVIRETPGGRDAKDARIQSMIPFFESGKILFPKRFSAYQLKYGDQTLSITKEMKKLEKQLREYPYGKKRDLIDVLAYIVRNIGYKRTKKEKVPLDPYSFEAIMEEIEKGRVGSGYPFAKARAYSANASPKSW